MATLNFIHAHMADYVRLDTLHAFPGSLYQAIYIRLFQNISGYIRLNQIKSGYIRLNQTKSGYIIRIIAS